MSSSSTRARARAAIAMAVILASCGSDESSGSGAEPAAGVPAGIVALASSDDGLPGEGVVIVGNDGEAVRLDGPTYERVGAIGRSGKALASNDDEAVLIDTATGTAEEVDLGGLQQTAPELLSEPGGERFVFLEDLLANSPLLLDLDNGDVVDLNDVLDEPAIISRDVFSDDETVLLLDTSEGPWILDPEAPGDARALDAPVGGYDLSPDGSTVVGGGLDGGIVTISVQDGTVENLDDEAEFARYVGEDILLEYPDELRLIDSDGEEIVATDTVDLQSGARVTGDQVVFERSDSTWVALDREGETRLDGVDGMTLTWVDTSGRWMIFADEVGPGAENVVGVDTQTGESRSFDLGDGFLIAPVRSATTGPRALLIVQGDESGIARVVDIESGESSDLPEGALGAALSPDGEQVAFSIPVDGPAPLFAAPWNDPDDRTQVAEGVMPVWTRTPG